MASNDFIADSIQIGNLSRAFTESVDGDLVFRDKSVPGGVKLKDLAATSDGVTLTTKVDKVLAVAENTIMVFGPDGEGAIKNSGILINDLATKTYAENISGNVETLVTSETNTSLSLKPDGLGGVTWGIDITSDAPTTGTIDLPIINVTIPSISGADLSTYTTSGGWVLNELLFDADLPESSFWSFCVPYDFSGDVFSVNTSFVAISGGNSRVGVDLLKMNQQTGINGSVEASVYQTVFVSTPLDFIEQTFSLSGMSLTGGDLVTLRIRRDATSILDTLNSDIGLIKVAVRW